MKTTIITLTTALLLLTGSALFAQESGDITASANVLESITVAGEENLNFGDVEIGNSVSVAPLEGGQFSIAGSDRNVSLVFTLPGSLENGTETLDISFSTTDAIWNNGNGNETVDPNDSFNADIDGGNLDVFIGGQVTAATDQEPGEYEGTITLTAEYDLD